MRKNYDFSCICLFKKFGIIVAIDLDVNNLLEKTSYEQAYEKFKNILREYINVDFLNDKIKELYDFYKKEKQEAECLKGATNE